MRLLELLDNNEPEKKEPGPTVRPAMDSGKSHALAKDPAGAIPHAIVNTQLRNTDTYMQYRYGLALAAAAAHENNSEFEQESAWSENVGLVAYTDQELELIKNADKLMGVKSDEMTDGSGSHEQDDVNTRSAISGAENA